MDTDFHKSKYDKYIDLFKDKVDILVPDAKSIAFVETVKDVVQKMGLTDSGIQDLCKTLSEMQQSTSLPEPFKKHLIDTMAKFLLVAQARNLIDTSLNGILEGISKEIVEESLQLGDPFSFGFYAGVFHANPFAFAAWRQFEDANIVLVGQNFFYLLNAFTWALNSFIHKSQNSGIAFEIDFLAGGLDRILQKYKSGNLSSEIVSNYCAYEPLHSQYASAQICRCVEKFLILHEIGHIKNGHPHSADKLTTAHEREADLFACNHLVGAFRSKINRDHKNELSDDFGLLAPVLFCCLNIIIEQYKPSENSAHLHPADRLKYCFDITFVDNSIYTTYSAQACVAFTKIMYNELFGKNLDVAYFSTSTC